MKVMISLCVTTKNSEKTIARCLESARGLVGEMIIVDTGSTDKTREIALKFGAKVFDFEWIDDFSAAKNFAVSKTSGDWVLSLDSDESISASDFDRVKKLSENTEFMGFYLTQRNYINNPGAARWVSSAGDEYEESKAASGFVPRGMVRFFRRDERIKFEGKIHDSVIKSINSVGGKIGVSEIPIHHYGELERTPEKTRKYIEVEKKNRKGDFFQEYQIGVQLSSIGELKEAAEFLLSSARLNPNFYLSWLELGIILMKSGKISEARPLIEKSLGLERDEVALNHLGLIEVHEKNYEKAISCFKIAIEMNPKNADFYFNCGQAMKQAGNNEEAEKMITKAAELNPFYLKYKN